MPKYVEMSVTDVVHESEIFGAYRPPKEENEEATNEVKADD